MALLRFTDFLGEKELNLESIKQYILFLLTEKNREPSGVRAELKILRAFCAYLVAQEVLMDNSYSFATRNIPFMTDLFFTELVILLTRTVALAEVVLTRLVSIPILCITVSC